MLVFFAQESGIVSLELKQINDPFATLLQLAALLDPHTELRQIPWIAFLRGRPRLHFSICMFVSAERDVYELLMQVLDLFCDGLGSFASRLAQE